MSLLKFFVKYKNLDFWNIFKICNFDFVLFWLWIWYESLVIIVIVIVIVIIIIIIIIIIVVIVIVIVIIISLLPLSLLLLLLSLLSIPLLSYHHIIVIMSSMQQYMFDDIQLHLFHVFRAYLIQSYSEICL